jgi:hypothetical protein
MGKMIGIHDERHGNRVETKKEEVGENDMKSDTATDRNDRAGQGRVGRGTGSEVVEEKRLLWKRRVRGIERYSPISDIEWCGVMCQG